MGILGDIENVFDSIAAAIPEVAVEVAYFGSRRADGDVRRIAHPISAIVTEEPGTAEWGIDSAAPTVPRIWRLRVRAADWPEVSPPGVSDVLKFRTYDGRDVSAAVAAIERHLGYYVIEARKREVGNG